MTETRWGGALAPAASVHAVLGTNPPPPPESVSHGAPTGPVVDVVPFFTVIFPDATPGTPVVYDASILGGGDGVLNSVSVDGAGFLVVDPRNGEIGTDTESFPAALHSAHAASTASAT